MITINDYEEHIDPTEHLYNIYYTVDGLSGSYPLDYRKVETNEAWDEVKAQKYVEANEATFLLQAQCEIEHEGLVRLNKATNKIEFAAPTATDKVVEALEARIATLEAAVDALGVKP